MLDLSIFIFIKWSQPKVADFRMLSTGLHLALSHFNMSARELELIIFAGRLL